MWGPGGPSCGVRFVCHALTAMGGFYSLTSYNNVKSLPSDLLDDFKNANALLLGLQINGMAVCFTRYYPLTSLLLTPGRGLLFSHGISFSLECRPSYGEFSSF